jgi:ABC-type nitrate/sulfonate/bicarbonate transport system substrate-binding protein
MTDLPLRPPLVSRRRVLQGAAALAGFSGLRPAHAAEPLAFITPFGFLPTFAPDMNGVSGGHFAKQGFDAKVLGGNGTASALQQVIAGRIDFVRASPLDMIKAVGGQKLPVRAVATLVQGANFYIVSHKERPLKTPQDLVGKTLGVVSVGGTAESYLDLTLLDAGIDKKAVKRQVTGNSPGAFALIENKRIDGFIASTQPIVALRAANAPAEITSFDTFVTVPGQAYICTLKTIEERPDFVVRYLKGLFASLRDMETIGLPATLDRVVKDFDVVGKQDKPLAVAAMAEEQKLWYSAGRENLLRNQQAAWNTARELMAKAGLGTVEDSAGLFTNEFVEKAAS